MRHQSFLSYLEQFPLLTEPQRGILNQALQAPYWEASRNDQEAARTAGQGGQLHPWEKAKICLVTAVTLAAKLVIP